MHPLCVRRLPDLAVPADGAGGGGNTAWSTQKCGGHGCGPSRRFSSAQPQPPAFVFDIDGVLIRGGTVLPAARRALARLYSADGALGICGWSL